MDTETKTEELDLKVAQRRHYFAPTDEGREEAQVYIASISGLEGIGVTFNFDEDKPEIPVESVLKHAKGQGFIQRMVEAAFGARLKGCLQNDPVEFPATIEGFIETSRKSESLKTFTEIGPRVIKFLKDQGLNHITQPMLKNILQSASFAETQYEAIDQAQWLFVLDKMIELATQKGLSTEILVHWIDKRDTTDLSTPEDVDFLSAFANFAGDADEAEMEEVEEEVTEENTAPETDAA